MFTWICPQCGREVPPSYDECPDCAAKQKAGPAAPSVEQQATPGPTVPPQVEPMGPQTPQQTTPPPPQTVRLPPPSGGMPTWLMTVLFALIFVGVVAGIYWTVQHFKKPQAQVSQMTLENPPVAKQPVKDSPYQSVIEVTGIRLYQGRRKETMVRFVVVNHSEAEINDLGGTVTLFGRATASDEENEGTFTFKVAKLGPNESADLSEKLNTTKKVYELPDWQKMVTKVLITSPQS